MSWERGRKRGKYGKKRFIILLIGFSVSGLTLTQRLRSEESATEKVRGSQKSGLKGESRRTNASDGTTHHLTKSNRWSVTRHGYHVTIQKNMYLTKQTTLRHGLSTEESLTGKVTTDRVSA